MTDGYFRICWKWETEIFYIVDWTMARIFAIRERRSGRRLLGKDVVVALIALVLFWFICLFVLATRWFHILEQPEKSMTRGHSRQAELHFGNKLQEKALEPQNLSRSGRVIATTDVRGNLGPAR